MQGGIKINYISNLILPFLVLFIIIYGYKKNIDIYDTFINGVKESFNMIESLFPTFIAMILAINLFIDSGVLNSFINLLKPILNIINIPFSIIPLALIRPISGSASLAYLNNIFENFGPDSFTGILSSVIQSSTDTTLYILTLYFGSIGIKKIRYSLFAGLFADLIGIITSIVIVNLLF